MHVNAVTTRRLAAGILALAIAAAGVAPYVAATPPSSGGGTSGKSVPAAPLDVNTASAADLQKVPGIGGALAQRIVEFREKNGPFSQVDDLVKIRGIGEKSIVHLKPYLTAGAAKAR